MATLLKTSRGQCDARCYNARGPDCDCVCGGINHGVGLIEGAHRSLERNGQLVMWEVVPSGSRRAAEQPR